MMPEGLKIENVEVFGDGMQAKGFGCCDVYGIAPLFDGARLDDRWCKQPSVTILVQGTCETEQAIQ